MTTKRKATRSSEIRRTAIAALNDKALMARLVQRVHERCRESLETPEVPERRFSDAFTDPDAAFSPFGRMWVK